MPLYSQVVHPYKLNQAVSQPHSSAQENICTACSDNRAKTECEIKMCHMHLLLTVQLSVNVMKCFIGPFKFPKIK